MRSLDAWFALTSYFEFIGRFNKLGIWSGNILLCQYVHMGETEFKRKFFLDKNKLSNFT